MLELDELAVKQLLHHHPADVDWGEFWWALVIGGNDGYVLIYPDGSSFHTYHNPEDFHA